MKLKPLLVLFLLSLALAPTIIPVHAQSNHTLEWGVEVGEEFTYVLQRAFFTDSGYREVLFANFPFIEGLELGQKAIVSIDNLEVIPSQINESSQIPISQCTMVRANDSTSLGAGLQSFVLPIGDWEFLNEMVNLTGFSGVTLIDTEEEWGTEGAASFRVGDGSIVTVSLEIRYEKENGTLNYLRQRYSTLGTDLIDMILVNWHPGMPTIVEAGLPLETILVISLGTAVGLIISSLVYIGYKRKKPLVQQLGE